MNSPLEIDLTKADKGIAFVTFATKASVMDRDLIRALAAFLRDVAHDYRWVVMKGKHLFSAGGSILEHHPRHGCKEMLLEFDDLFRLMLDPHRKFRTLCAAHSKVYGGALTWLTFADRSIAVTGTRCFHPEIEMRCFACVGTAYYPMFAPQWVVDRWLFANGEIPLNELREYDLLHEVVDSLDDAIERIVDPATPLPPLRLSPEQAAEFRDRLAYSEFVYDEKFVRKPSPDYLAGVEAKSKNPAAPVPGIPLHQ